MSIQLYGLPQCSTCVKARDWLTANGVDHSFQDYRAQPIAPSKLKKWAKELGGWEKLVNRASMTWRNLDPSRKEPQSDEQWLGLIADFPALIKRPLAVFQDGSVTAGFNEKRYADKLGVK